MRACFVWLLLCVGAACSVSGQEKLVNQGKTPREWLEGSYPDLPDKLEQRLIRLSEFGPAAREFIPDLVELLRSRIVKPPPSEDSSTKVLPTRLGPRAGAAAGTLAAAGPPAVPALLDALASDDPRVRAGAAYALGFVR